MLKIPILIVDDRREYLLTLESLQNNPDLQLVRVESGNEALAKILEYEFALILIDSRVPGMDGYEIAEVIRASVRTRSVPLLFVTAERIDREHIFKGYNSGAVDYLFNPIEPQILKRKVGVFLKLHRQRQQLEEKTRELDAKILELEVLHKELEEKNEKLELLSSLDGLTGLFNRRYFDHNLVKEWKQAIRDKLPLSLLLVEIDYFNEYNNGYGPLAADDCLRKVAQSLYESLLRPTDIIARYGGNEFAAILPHTGREGAERVAHRMINYVVQLGIIHKDSSATELVTVSIGASSVFPAEKLSVSSLLDLADEALCEVKERGRDGVRMKLGDE